MIVGDILAMLRVPGYNAMAQTISKLAARQGQQYEDPGSIALALSLLLTASLLARSTDNDWLAGDCEHLLLCAHADRWPLRMRPRRIGYRMVWIAGAAFLQAKAR